VICLLEYQVMSHIAVTRLMQLCAEAIVQDEQEANHLRNCHECRVLLRKFAEDRSRSLLHKSLRSDPEEGELGKSA
jgi:hypothetical protein